MVTVPDKEIESNFLNVPLKSSYSIAFIIVYFGKWPVWLPAFLASCRTNADISWLIFTDCAAPDDSPPNVVYISATLRSIRELANSRLGMDIALRGPRKLCDMKPTYGILFEEHIVGYDFWGFCDLDIIWGNIRNFWTDEILEDYDLITTRKELIAGHMCIIRNLHKFRQLPLEHSQFRDFMRNSEYCWFDEKGFSDLVATRAESGFIRAYWPGYMINFYKPVDNLPSVLSWLDRYSWNHGKLLSISEGGKEILYLHFMNWKDTMRWCGVPCTGDSTSFTINYCSITTPVSNSSMIYRVSSRLSTATKPKLYLLFAVRWIRRILCSVVV